MARMAWTTGLSPKAEASWENRRLRAVSSTRVIRQVSDPGTGMHGTRLYRSLVSSFYDGFRAGLAPAGASGGSGVESGFSWMYRIYDGVCVVRGEFAPSGFGGRVCGWGVVGGRQDLCIVVSVRPGWARNYFTYFFVYSARCSDAPARGLGQSRGHQWGGRR